MQRTIAFDLYLPLAPRPDKLSDVATEDFIQLVRNSELSATLILSGLCLSRSAKSRDSIAALGTLCREGKLEIAIEPLGAPLPGEVDSANLALRIGLAKDWFGEKFGFQPTTLVLDPRYPSEDLVSEFSKQGIVHFIFLPLFPRRGVARQTLQLRRAGSGPFLSRLSEMTSLHAVEATTEIFALEVISRLSRNDQEQLYSKLRTWLRSESSQVVSLRQLHLAHTAPVSHSTLAALLSDGREAPIKLALPAAAQSYRERVQSLRREIIEYHRKTDSGVENETRAKRFTEINRFLSQADAGDGFCTGGLRSFFDPRTREMLYDGLLRAQVAFDSERRPEVDPNSGWVEVISPLGQKGEIHEDLVVDTQLIRVYFDNSAGGALRSIEYRPRKLALQNVLSPQGVILPSFTESVVKIGPGNPPDRSYSPQVSFASARVTQRTGAIVVCRFDTMVVGGGTERLPIQKDYTFRSGIGGHLANSTTGFSVEYSLTDDRKVDPELHLVISLAVTLPSAATSAAVLFPLMCVGGVSSTKFSFAEQQHIPGDSVPGGIYGARLVDTLQDFLIDVRTSRPLWGMFTEPVNIPGDDNSSLYQGSILSLVVPCARLASGLSNFTVFLSIM